MTSLPDWLVERAALDEVPPAQRPRLAHADPAELAARIAAVRADDAAELARHPAPAAVAQIQARATAARRRHARRAMWVATAGAAAATAAVALLVVRAGDAREVALDAPPAEVTRVKGAARLHAFRLVDDRVERLEPDAVVRGGDLIQLRYSAGGQRYGVIASIDGAGVVTLHHPADEDAPAAATALAPRATALPDAYALDDAPGFERFFFITADAPIDVAASLATLRAFAQRADSATAALALPPHLRQWSLRLRKPEPTSKAPTP